jgi:hypothetical protein
MIYDHYVSLLKHDTNIDDILPGIINYNNNNTEENIVILGNKLAKYIFFAKDIEKENIILQNTSYNSASVSDNKSTRKRPNTELFSKGEYDLNHSKRLQIPISGGKKKHTKKRKNVKKRNTKKRRRTIKNK